MKLCQSSSISGPSDRSKPIDEKIDIIRFLTIESGCLVPVSKTGPGRDKSLICFFLLTEPKAVLS